MDAPDLEAWLDTWLEGSGWYEESSDDADLAPWPDFRIRTAATQAS